VSTRTNVIILTLAGRTGGVVTRAELLEAGLADSTIDLRLRRGFLVRYWAGLYEVPELATELTPLYRAVKAVPGSAVSHLSAARLWGLPVRAADPNEAVHITVTRGGPRSDLPGITVHRTRRPADVDISPLAARLPVTSAARTILDLSDPRTGLGDRRLAHIVETYIIAARSLGSELSELLDRTGSRGVPGAARLRRVLADLVDDQPIPDSTLETRFADLLREQHLHGFERQVRPPWYDGRRGVVDFADRAARLIVEVDGHRWHSTTQAMAEDRRRDRVAAAHGWLVLRITWTDLDDRPVETARQLATILRARRDAPVPDQLAP
jgi:very-short-patch-repair endonuclease/predicted transcriptional regulator of viral defense system